MVRPGKNTKRSGKRAKAMVRGHAVTKLNQVGKKPSQDKGRLGKRTGLVRKVIRDVSGFAPYEKRVMDLLKAGGKDEKKALKLCKKRLGTH